VTALATRDRVRRPESERRAGLRSREGPIRYHHLRRRALFARVLEAVEPADAPAVAHRRDDGLLGEHLVEPQLDGFPLRLGTEKLLRARDLLLVELQVLVLQHDVHSLSLACTRRFSMLGPAL